MDLQLAETNNGGDLIRKVKDLFVIEGFENMPYLAMFGGNPYSPTPVRRLENEQAFDFWGNALMFSNNQGVQFNSFTEAILNEVALNSSGLLQIETAVKKDFDFMKPFAQVEATVSITSHDKLEIYISVQQPGNIESKEFIYIWDATKKELELVIDETFTAPLVTSGQFDYQLDFSF